MDLLLLQLIDSLTKRVEELERKLADLTQPKPVATTGACHRCGRQGHWASTCYARTHANGTDLDSGDSEYNSE